MRLEDGLGRGNYVEVTNGKRLSTSAINFSPQHHAAHENSAAYQLLMPDLPIKTTEQGVIYLKNTSDQAIVITYIRVQSTGAADMSTDAYFRVLRNPAYASGGELAGPINTMFSSSKDAVADAYIGESGTPMVLNDTSEEMDRNYQANSMQCYSKEGSIILETGNSIAITHKGSSTAGLVNVRLSFYYADHG